MTGAIRFTEVVERIKDVISLDVGEKYVTDKDVAFSLQISVAKLATCKRRNSLPVDDIVYFCIKRRVSITWVMIGIEDYGVPPVHRGINSISKRLKCG